MSGSNHCDWCGSSWCADCVAERTELLAEVARARIRAAANAATIRDQDEEIGWFRKHSIAAEKGDA